MNTLISFAMLISLSTYGTIKTGQLLGVDASTSTGGLYDVDPATGDATLLYPLEVLTGGLAVGPDGTLFGSSNELVIIDPNTGIVTNVGSIGFGSVTGLAFGANGTLYGFDNFTDQLITIDRLTGEGSAVGSVGMSIVGTGLGFATDGTLYLVGEAVAVTKLYTVDTEIGSAREVGVLGSDFTSTGGIEAVGAVLYASAHDSFNKPYDALVTVDAGTGEAAKVGGFCPFSKDCPFMNGLAFLPGAGDGDRDGDVDEADFAFFEECFGPLDEPGKSPYCAFLDSDKDGDLDCTDWETFIPNWTEDTDPPTFPTCDCDTPPCDVPCGGLPSCDGDANCDGLVDPLDSGFVFARFGCPVGAGDPLCDAADVNLDSLVDPLDVGFVLARFGTCDGN